MNAIWIWLEENPWLVLVAWLIMMAWYVRSANRAEKREAFRKKFLEGE